jgi:hypothetical protein
MNRSPTLSLSLLLMLSLTAGARGQDAFIRVRADRPGPEVSRHMTGVCTEEVNHEIYGGIVHDPAVRVTASSGASPMDRSPGGARWT